MRLLINNDTFDQCHGNCGWCLEDLVFCRETAKKVNEWTNICHRDPAFFSSKHLGYSNLKKKKKDTMANIKDPGISCQSVFLFSNFRASPSRNKSIAGV